MFDPKRHLSGVAFARVLPELLADRLPERAKVLDLGTGCGVLAAAATEVARIVVATDISQRAIDDATNNLRDLDIEVRAGDLFEPVWGEWFDLIIMNPPYEIGPSDDLRFGSPDLLERFGREVHEYAGNALIGWPADGAEELIEATGLTLEQVRVVPTKGDPLAVFEWTAPTN